MINPMCECGCGSPVNNPKYKYIRGHHWEGRRKKGIPKNKTDHMQGSRDRRTKWAREIKAANGCAVCGFDYPSALEFHHLDPSLKMQGIATMCFQNRSYERIITEMEKCVILCANHHRMVEDGAIECPNTPPEILPPPFVQKNVKKETLGPRVLASLSTN